MDHALLDQWAVVTEKQKELANQFLLHVCQKTIEASDLGTEDFKRREKQLSDFRSVLGMDSSKTMQELAKTWWEEESQNEDINSSIYRLLMMLLKTITSCPFVKDEKSLITRKVTKKADTSLFEEVAAKAIHFFLEQSKSFVSDNKLISQLSSLQERNLDKELYGARYKLLDKDFEIGKGLAFGITAGAISTMVMGPVIGTAIGEMAGLSGAAATSYGLALLGGGSIASGGFGMAGGTMLIGLGVGFNKAAKNALNAAEIDTMLLAQAQVNLPIFLAAGRLFKEEVCIEVARAIHKKIDLRFDEQKDRLYYAKAEDNQNPEHRQRIKTQTKTAEIYKRASEMSDHYEWTSGYDIYNKIKDMAS